MIDNKVILEQLENYDSFYMYDEEGIKTSIQNLKENFKNINFLYSMKTNNNYEVVKSIVSEDIGVDAASAREVMIAKNNDVKRENIQYSAPGKSIKDIKETINDCIIIADSLNEIDNINKVAKQNNMIAQIGIRVNPSFSFYKSEGVSSKFGIDENQLFDKIEKILNYPNINIVGLHIHLKSQELDIEILKNYYQNVVKLAKNFQNKTKYELAFLNMGSGIGINYSSKDLPIDLNELGTYTQELVTELKTEFPNLKIYIETGRYLVGKNGVYVTKVLDRKISYGKTYVILHNTLNGFIRPSLAKLISSYAENEELGGSEPLFTSKNAFEFTPVNKNRTNESEKVTLVGNLCTGTDVIGDDIYIKKLEIGDGIIINNAGSYAEVLSPIQFSSQRAPKSLFLTKNKQVINTQKN